MQSTVVGAGNAKVKRTDAAPVLTELTLYPGDLAEGHWTLWNAVLCISLSFWLFVQSTFKAFFRCSEFSLLTPVYPINLVAYCYRAQVANPRPAGGIRPPPCFIRPGTMSLPGSSAELSLNC